jgi:CheY-like chemotaxis protein
VAGISFVLERVETRSEFLAEITRFRPDLILSDFSLPSFNGMAALEIALQKCPDVPFIFVTGSLGEEVAIDTLKKGATDYVLKHRPDAVGACHSPRTPGSARTHSTQARRGTTARIAKAIAFAVRLSAIRARGGTHTNLA